MFGQYGELLNLLAVQGGVSFLLWPVLCHPRWRCGCWNSLCQYRGGVAARRSPSGNDTWCGE